jgi:hypothetical protein
VIEQFITRLTFERFLSHLSQRLSGARYKVSLEALEAMTNDARQ